MKISTEIYSAAAIVGEEKAIELIAKAGFDAWDFSMFDMVTCDRKSGEIIYKGHPLESKDAVSFAKRLRKVGEDNGIYCNQSHTAYPLCYKAVRESIYKAIECSAEAGAKIVVVHPDMDASVEENVELYQKYLEFAKGHGVMIATENMLIRRLLDEPSKSSFVTPERIKPLFDLINDDNFVLCLDVGHAEIGIANTSSLEMIDCFKNKIRALHLHDNDKNLDSHQIPFSMNIDFPPIMRALKETVYNGDLTLESDSFLGSFNRENVLDGLKAMRISVEKLKELMK